MPYPIPAYLGDVWTTANPSIALGSPESCTDSGDHTNYQASVHSFWDWNSTFTVQNSPNGSTGWVNVTDWTFQWATGKLIFNTARTPGTNAFTRISAGSYFTATQLDASYVWSATVTAKLEDVTTFQVTGGWQLNAATIKSAKGDIETYRNDSRIFNELGNLLVFQLYIDKTNNIRWQFFAICQSPTDTVKATKIEMQKITFSSVRDVYFLTS